MQMRVDVCMGSGEVVAIVAVTVSVQQSVK